MTLVAVIGMKGAGAGALHLPFLLPRLAVLDPRFTLGLPLPITAATAMDAMTHAIEAFIGNGKNPVSDALALMAVEKIATALPRVLAHPTDKGLRLQLAEGSTWRAWRFPTPWWAGARPRPQSGARCHLPHGLCMNLFLPTVLDYNRPGIDPELARLLLPWWGRSALPRPRPRETPGHHRGVAGTARYPVADGQAAPHPAGGGPHRQGAAARDPGSRHQRWPCSTTARMRTGTSCWSCWSEAWE